MVRFMTDRLILMGSLTAFGVMSWWWGDENSHRETEKFLDSMDREEMERLQPAVYDGANYVAEETKEHAQLEASQKDLSEELDVAEEGIKLFDDFIARIHQETETANDLQRICEEVHGAEEEEIELSTDNIAISALNAELDRANKKIKGLMASLEKAESQNDELREELSAKTFVQVREMEVSNNIGNLALMDDLQRANKNIESLFVSLEKAEARNDQICDELFAKAYVEKELENAREEIRILEKKLERAALESELNAAVEEVYRLGTKLDTVLDENCKLKTELLIKKDVVCDLEMAEEELEKLWKEFAGVKAENRRLKRDLSEERATRNALMKADEKNKILEEEIRNLTSVADEFAIYKEKYQDMMERNTKLEMELNHKNYAISQLVDGFSQTHPELKELYHMDISEESEAEDCDMMDHLAKNWEKAPDHKHYVRRNEDGVQR
ncbi:flagellar attachment zone protein 1-like [Palaemon carinicauda]|uniref:flagellar attachment zone protein 1-like n=1 Tax=Palaemon carinicauda TaxID=392227 RepID=UPI0035B67E3F